MAAPDTNKNPQVSADFKNKLQELCDREGVEIKSADIQVAPDGGILLTIQACYYPDGWLKKFFKLV